MNFLEQYKTSEGIIIQVPSYIDNSFLKNFVDEYKVLLQQKVLIGAAFLEEPKQFKLIFQKEKDDESGEDFDLVFISYLVLLKLDFPNFDIGLYFSDFEETSNYETQFYQLNHHRQHLIINGKTEFFKLYKGNKLYQSNFIVKSGSYLPPLVITPESAVSLFSRKKKGYNFKSTIDQVIQSTVVKYFEEADRDAIFSNFQNQYLKIKGKPSRWTYQDLSGLYLIRTIFDLYLLRLMINNGKGTESNYKIGLSIVNNKEDQESADDYRRGVYKTLIDNDVFNLNDMETYLLSILIQHNEIFKIPTSRNAMYLAVKPFLSDKEQKVLLTDTRELRIKFILIFNDNLKRVINYVKDLSYGLEELSKNIIEHTVSQYGVITGRVYQFSRINHLKTLEKDWGKGFENNQKFLDLNVIDTGLTSIKHSYQFNLEEERKGWIQDIANAALKKGIDTAYADDIKEIGKYELDNFFNFNSIKLYHQINRVKARLGLLIFSQSILQEKKALVHISSNSLKEARTVGCYLFHNGLEIVERVSKNYLSVGTNYNFIIPIEEKLVYRETPEQASPTERGESSSVFLELHQFKFDESGKFRIKKVSFNPNKVPINKYQKLDFLKDQVGNCKTGEVPLINAGEIKNILTNSSDWVRFLANMQFAADDVKDMIVYHMDADMYVEIINILRLFDKLTVKNTGFWKKDCQVLFFIPVENDGQVFWFNSLLTSNRYAQFIKLNKEIALYHLNFSRITEEEDLILDVPLLSKPDSVLFSSSGKLMNFELLITNGEGLTLFEETTRSLLNVEITDQQDED